MARELAASTLGPDGTPVRKRVRVLEPAGWTGDDALDSSSIRLLGPEGEGEILIAVVLHPEGLGEHLTRLKNTHPGAVPSPPNAMTVKGINPERGERATRFVITGREVGEMVMIERGGVIVLFATIVEPDAWSKLEPILASCYPSVRVDDLPALRREKLGATP